MWAERGWSAGCGRWALLLWMLGAAGMAPAGDNGAAPAETGAPDRTLRFAQWLFSQHDFYRAITEYERFLFENPGSEQASWVRFRIGESYLAGGRTGAAREVFEELRLETSDQMLRRWSTLALARTWYLEGRLQQSQEVLEAWLPEVDDLELRGFGLYLSGCIALKNGQAERAQEAFVRIWAGHPLAERAWLLAGQSVKLTEIPRKQPWLAGLLSLIPGLGHLYLGEYTVGLTALVWNGLFGFATYDAFQHGSIGLGTLLAVLELLWYSGTIYGAVSGAERFNRDQQQNFLDRLQRLSGLDIPFPDPQAVSLILLQGRF